MRSRVEAIPETIHELEATRPWLRLVADAPRPRRSGGRRFRLARGPAVLRLANGSVLGRGSMDDAWVEHALAPLTHRLLLALCVRSLDDSESPCAVRGCLPTRALARQLGFRSRYANEDNVRQVVRRLRGVLAELGGEAFIAAAPGRGYYLDCTVDPET